MAIATGNYPLDNSTLANFQAWSSAIYNAFIAFGWLQTGDSGQAPNPIAAVPSSAYAYWIFKANDAQASALPIYVKVEIGYSVTSPRIRMTVGTNSSGTGTITGQVCSGAPWEITYVQNFTALEANQGSTAYPCFFSGDAGEFRMYMWQSITIYSGLLFVIERSKNANGAKTPEYYTVLFSTSTSNSLYYAGKQQSMGISSVGNAELGIITVPLTIGSGTGAAFGTVAALPVFPILGKVGNPMLGLLAACAGDINDGVVVTINDLYGASHQFVGYRGPSASGGLSVIFGERRTIGTVMAGLMRYE